MISGRFVERIATRSPGSTPAAARIPAMRAATSGACVKVQPSPRQEKRLRSP